MNAPVRDAAWDSARWDTYTAHFNEWRGACLDVFTRAEHAVTETLVSLHAAAGATDAPKLPHLGGSRLGELAQTLAANDRPGSARLVELLEAFRQHQDLRTSLCHGVAKIVVDRQERWSVIIMVLELRAGRANRELIELTERDLSNLLAQLRKDGQVLGSLLGQLRTPRTTVPKQS